MTYRVQLQRVDRATALRSKSVTGWTNALPEMGEQFLLVTKPIDKTQGDTRMVTTSPVVSILGQGPQVVFQTATGSTYQLTIKPPLKPRKRRTASPSVAQVAQKRERRVKA